METFKKLMEENAIAEKKKQERMDNDANNLKVKMDEFAQLLDNDMLLAIGAYGKDAYDWGNNKCREFENEDSWNKMRIIVSKGVQTNGNPTLVVVLNGEHGLLICGNCVETIVAGVRNNKFMSSRTDASVWTESEMCPDRFRCNWFGADTFKIANRRIVGDNRTWFDRCYDAMPSFVAELSSYLSNRAKSVK